MRTPEKFVFLKTRKENIPLSSYQIERIFSFPSDKKRNIPFSSFWGFLDEEEISILEKRVKDFLTLSPSFGLEEGRIENLMEKLVEVLNLPSFLSRKINDYVEFYILSSANFSEEDFFKEDLPLPVRLTLQTMGKSLKEQFFDFLKNGGIVTVFCYRRPPPFYVKAVDSLDGGLSLQEKILYVLSKGRENKDNELIEASHQFIIVDFIPPYEIEEKDEPGNPFHLRKIINRRLDENYEEEYARVILIEELLKTHMGEVKTGLIIMSGIASIFYFIDQIIKGKIGFREYQVFQAFIKLITHLSANFIDFYSQYKLFLEGKSFFEQLRDFLRRLTWRELFIFANGGFFDLLSEMAGEINYLFGAIIFGLEPMIGTISTSVAGSLQLAKHDKESKKNRFRILLENPAVLGMNIAAFLTLLTSIGFLGLAKQFHNPLAVVAVGGISEPIYASFFTELIKKRRIEKLKEELKNSKHK